MPHRPDARVGRCSLGGAALFGKTARCPIACREAPADKRDHGHHPHQDIPRGFQHRLVRVRVRTSVRHPVRRLAAHPAPRERSGQTAVHPVQGRRRDDARRRRVRALCPRPPARLAGGAPADRDSRRLHPEPRGGRAVFALAAARVPLARRAARRPARPQYPRRRGQGEPADAIPDRRRDRRRPDVHADPAAGSSGRADPRGGSGHGRDLARRRLFRRRFCGAIRLRRLGRGIRARAWRRAARPDQSGADARPRRPHGRVCGEPTGRRLSARALYQEVSRQWRNASCCRCATVSLSGLGSVARRPRRGPAENRRGHSGRCRKRRRKCRNRGHGCARRDQRGSRSRNNGRK